MIPSSLLLESILRTTSCVYSDSMPKSPFEVCKSIISYTFPLISNALLQFVRTSL